MRGMRPFTIWPLPTSCLGFSGCWALHCSPPAPVLHPQPISLPDGLSWSIPAQAGMSEAFQRTLRSLCQHAAHSITALPLTAVHD